MASVARSEPMARPTRAAQKTRREQVEGALKELEERQKKAKRAPLSVRITQAGLNWSKQRFIVISAALGVVGFLAALWQERAFWPRWRFAFAAGFGLPLWMLSWLKKRRESRFLERFARRRRRDRARHQGRPAAARQPQADRRRGARTRSAANSAASSRRRRSASRSAKPASSFTSACRCAEANFFGIVISIQQRAGGNLSEALGNLSRVLRDRKKMKAKIQAMSQEAKASASIIGALPIFVMGLV